MGRLGPRNAETLRLAQIQHRRARDRSGGVCEFEKKTPGYPDWTRCTRRGWQAAHIYPRRDCAKAREHADVVLYACQECHTAYDDPALAPPGWIVRVPPKREAAAWKAIQAHSKVLPVRKKPPA